ncbi:MAG TPA: OmpH family outer membrane protein [Alphaproteobacteria bacterium]|nr:OmpH family outer membrane protein [Alphaproteobacteria bacterium]
MKKYVLHVIAAMAAVFAFAATPAFAATAAEAAADGTMRFGIVDLDKLITESIAGKAINKALNDKYKTFETEIAKEEKSLITERDKIKQETSKLSKEEFEAKVNAFEKKYADAQKMVQQRRQTFDAGANSGTKKLREEALKVTAEIAAERKLDIVFSDNSVVLAERAFDITNEALERLNKKVKSVSIDWTPPKKK